MIFHGIKNLFVTAEGVAKASALLRGESRVAKELKEYAMLGVPVFRTTRKKGSPRPMSGGQFVREIRALMDKPVNGFVGRDKASLARAAIGNYGHIGEAD